MTDIIQDKRDSLELAVLFRSEKDLLGRQAIIRTFERQLADYLKELLTPDLDDVRALQIRYKAIGVLDVLDKMGIDIEHVMEKAPVKKSISDRVHQAVGSSY